MLELAIISDSTGETAGLMTEALMIQFPNLEYSKKIYSNISSVEKLEKIMDEIKGTAVIIMTVVLKDVVFKLNEFAKENNIFVIDLLSNQIERLENITGQKALNKPRLMRNLNNNYFRKMEALEFAMSFDDGKNPKGLLKADIVLVGVSRTSKTPLSVFLANKNYKVANLPLVPEIDLPEEIFKVDSNKIIGLIIDSEKLNEIRNQRLKALGLKTDSDYANDSRILRELEYSKNVFERLNCRVIDVSGSTIEETAAKILSYIQQN